MTSRPLDPTQIPEEDTPEDEDSVRLAEPASEVGNYEVRYGQGGAVYGPRPTTLVSPEKRKPLTLDNYNPNEPVTSLDQLVITPEEFKQGYRLTGSLGPPINVTLTQQALSQVSEAVNFIDTYNPKLANQLKNSPEMMFTIPEIAASVDETWVRSMGLSGGPAVERIMAMMTEENWNVFDHRSERLQDVLRQTPVTMQFMQDHGDRFNSKQKDIVSTVLAVTPQRWRDRVAGLAYRWLDERGDEMVDDPRVMDEFLVWLWNESRVQQESEQFAGSGFGNALDLLSQPYYYVQEKATSLYNHIVAPEDVAWRNALTPGQTIAISMGADPSERGWTYKSGVIDFFGTFILDPINVAAGVGLGAKTARAFPLAQEALQANRVRRAAQGVIPLVGRRGANHLPVGTRSAWQRLGYHMFAKDVDGVLANSGSQKMIRQVASHFEDGGSIGGLVEKFPKLRSLLGEDGGGLKYIASSDPVAVEDGFRALLQADVAAHKSTVEEVIKAGANLRKKFFGERDRLLRSGELGLDDLTELDGVRGQSWIVDGDSKHMVIRAADDAVDTATEGRLVFTADLKDMNLQDPDNYSQVLDWASLLMRGSDDMQAVPAVSRTRVVYDKEAGEFLIKEVPVDELPKFTRVEYNPETGSIAIYDVDAPTTRVRPQPFDSERVKEVMDEMDQLIDKPNVRRVRIEIDPERLDETLPGEIVDSLWRGIAESGAQTPVSQIIKDAIRTGELDLQRVAEVNAQHGLGVLYGGFGGTFGSEINAQRVGVTGGSRYTQTDYVRPAIYGEGPTAQTDPIGMLFPNAVYATDDPSLARQFDDLGRPLEESAYRPPTDYVMWDKKESPVLINMDERNEDVVRIVREEIGKWSDTQEFDILTTEDEIIELIRYSEGTIGEAVDGAEFTGKYGDMYDEMLEQFTKAAEKRQGRQLSAYELDQLEIKTRDIVTNEALMDSAAEQAEAQFINGYKAKHNKNPSPQEIQEFNRSLAAKMADELAGDLGRRGKTREQFESIKMSFESADDYWSDVYNLPGWENLERMDDMKIRSNFLVQHDLDVLIEMAERGDASSMQLMYQLAQTMESGGFQGRRINRVMNSIQKELRKAGYDGFKYGRGSTTPVPHKEVMTRLLDEQRRHKANLAALDAKFLGGEGVGAPEIGNIKGVGPAIATRLTEAGYETAADIVQASVDQLAQVKGLSRNKAQAVRAEAENLLAASRPTSLPEGAAPAAYTRAKQMEINRYVAERERLKRLRRGESQIVGFFGGGKRGNRVPSSIRVSPAKESPFLELAVPANEAARQLFQRLGGDWFFQLKPSQQKRFLEIAGREGVGEGLGIAAKADEAYTGSLLDDVGLRPRELPAEVDDMGRPANPYSTDVMIDDIPLEQQGPSMRDRTGPRGFTRSGEAEELQLSSEMPGIPTDPDAIVGGTSNRGRLSDTGVQGRLPLDPAVTLTDDEITLLVNLAHTQGYDSVTMPDGYKVLTNNGRKKARSVRPGKSTADLSELNRLRADMVRHQAREAWATATEDIKLYALKSMPRPPSTLIKHMGKLNVISDSENWAAQMARRIGAGWSELRPPESISITNTKEGYAQLRSFLRHMGVRQSVRNHILDQFVSAKTSERWGLMTDIMNQVSDEIDHPLMKTMFQEWTNSGGLQSYFPTKDEFGNFVERTARGSSKDADRVVNAPGLPSHLSNTYPMPDESFYKTLTRYRRGKRLPSVVSSLSTLGGTKNNRIEAGKEIIRKLADQGIEIDSMEEALALGYSLVGKEELMGPLAHALNSAHASDAWKFFHRNFTRVQLAARPFTWMARVVLFDEAARGALFDATSMYKNPFEWMATIQDNYRISQLPNIRQDLVMAINEEIPTLFRGIDNADEALRIAESIIPDFRRAAELVGVDDFENVNQIRNGLFKLIAEDIAPSKDLDLSRFSNRLRSARRKINKSRRAASKYGLSEEFLWDDILEIQQKGLAAAIMKQGEATFRPMEWRAGQMTRGDAEVYGRAYGAQLHQFVTDPWGRITISELASRVAGTASDGHIKLINSSHWDQMKLPLSQIAEYNGYAWKGDKDLAKWYLDTILLPQASDLLSPLAGDDMRKFALSLLNNKAVATVGGSQIPLDARKADGHKLVNTIAKITRDNRDHVFPRQVAGSFDITSTLSSEGNVLNRMAGTIIDVFGEKTTQALNRRPSWLKFHQQELEYMRSRGFPEEIAQAIAKQEASRRVNHIYFNMKDVPHHIEQLNKVIPFFSAMYEVTTSWGWKVPMAQSALGWPGGVATIGRKVDRFLQGLIRMGLVEVDDELDEDATVPTRSLSLMVGGNFEGNNDLANQYTKVTKAMISVPELMVRHFIDFVGEVPPLDDLNEHGSWRISIGNPLNPASHGFGSALQFSAGLNPLGSLALGQVRNRSFWNGDARKVEAPAGMTLGELAEQEDVTPQEILLWNAEMLKKNELITEAQINQMMRGYLPIDSYELDAEVALNVPRSTWAGEILDEIFFPFDQMEGGVGVASAFLPSWANFFMRGWGIHNAVGEDTPYEVLDSGRVVFNTGEGPGAQTALSNMFVNSFLPPETRTFMAGEIVLALQHLEANEGVLSDYYALAAQYGAMKDRLPEGFQIIEGENGLEFLNPTPQYAELEDELNAMKTRIDEHSTLIMKRATEMAASVGLTRGLAGLFGPANPRYLYEEAEKRAIYYDSKSAVEDAKFVDGVLYANQLPRISGVKDVESFFTLADMWFNDMSGDGPQRWFKEHYPTVAPFLKGKTYWGPGGEPIRARTYSEYVDRVREGQELPYSPEIAMLLNLKTDADISREVDIIENYGTDPNQSAASILWDYWNYKDTIQAEYQTQRDFIDVVDAQFGGVWEDFTERTSENFPLLSDELGAIFDYIDRDIDIASAALELDLNSATRLELEEAVEQLEAAAQGMRQVRRNFNIQPLEARAASPRERLISQYFEETLAPYYEQQAEFRRRLAEPKLSSEDRSQIFTEMRIWENQIAQSDAWITTADGSRVRVPNGLEFREVASDPVVQQGFIKRNLTGNPRWNSLYDNVQMVEMFPQMADYIPVNPDYMQDYDDYDRRRNLIFRKEETGELTLGDARKLREALEDEFRNRLRSEGRIEEERFMFEMTPAERLDKAGLLTDPWMQNAAHYVRDVFNMADSAELARTGTDTRPALINVLNDMKDRFQADPTFRQNVVALANELGYDDLNLDEFLAEIFIGMYNSEL